MTQNHSIIQELESRFGASAITSQTTHDDIPTLWVQKERVGDVLRYLKEGVSKPYRMLYDLTAIDERFRAHRDGQPDSDFTVLYQLLSFERNEDIRIKVALKEETATLPSIVPLWSSANWYEREVWDMFGIIFEGHPHLKRILMPPTWEGHPLRKDHPARATDLPPFRLPDEKEEREQKALQFRPEEWGMKRRHEE